MQYSTYRPVCGNVLDQKAISGSMYLETPNLKLEPSTTDLHGLDDHLIYSQKIMNGCNFDK